MTNSQQAYTLAERIREGVAAIRVQTEKGDATVTLSTGIVEMTHPTAKYGFDSPAETVEKIILHADEAMYAAKKAGLNCIKIYSVKS
jgi:GGDEF domain-containing protein